jgi:hypothetical protein
MIHSRLFFLSAGVLALWASPCISSADTRGGSPDFQEVYDLVKAHAVGLSPADLNEAAVHGLLASLGPKASLVTNGEPATVSKGEASVAKAEVFAGNINYVRITRVESGLNDLVAGAFRRLSATNQPGGLILDLRYASGNDYVAAAATADLFLAKAQPLLNWGNGSASSHDKTNAIQLPLAILVNGQTSAAAEALAAVLRSSGAGLLLGSKTAGEAMVMQEFPLKNGQRLRIATAPVALGNGTTLSTEGLKPDIDVTVNLEDERAYYADAFRVTMDKGSITGDTNSLASQSAGTNGSRRVRFNEAELVREHREGRSRDADETPIRRTRDADDALRAAAGDVESPLVSDPALARAIDLLKGLAVVRQSRS